MDASAGSTSRFGVIQAVDELDLGAVGRALWCRKTLIIGLTLAGAAIAIYLSGTRGLQPLVGAPFLIPWWLLIAAFVVAEAAVMHLHIRGEAHSISLREIPLVCGLCLAVQYPSVSGRNVAARCVRIASA